MVAQIINANNGVNNTTNTLVSKRDVASVQNQIINEGNGSNGSTNIIHNEAQTLYATNQIINVYDGPDPWCSFPPSCPGPWSPLPPCVPSPWWCYNPWPCCFGIGCCCIPWLYAAATLPLLLLW
jgi:hypothetical protein